MKRFISNLKPEDIIAKLKQGIVLKDDEVNDTYEMVDGLVVRKTQYGWTIGDIISSSEKIYFDEPEPEIEVVIGRFYKTRDDRRAFVFSKNSEGRYCVVIENELPYTVSANGYYSDETDNDKDLVEVYKVSGTKSSYEDRVLECIKEKKSYKEIQEELGISHTTIANIKRRNGVKMRKSGSESVLSEYIKLLKKGYSNKQIASVLGVSYATVANYIYTRPDLKKLRKEKQEKNC